MKPAASSAEWVRRMAFWGRLAKTWTPPRPAKTTGGVRNRLPIGASEASRIAVLGAFVCLAPMEAGVPITARPRSIGGPLAACERPEPNSGSNALAGHSRSGFNLRIGPLSSHRATEARPVRKGPPGVTRGTVPQKTIRPALRRWVRVKRWCKSRRRCPGRPGQLGKPHPEQGQKERGNTCSARTFEGCPPESAGRPHEVDGNVGPRWMAVSPAAARRPGDRIRRRA
jgi:hypothetical protein